MPYVQQNFERQKVHDTIRTLARGLVTLAFARQHIEYGREDVRALLTGDKMLVLATCACATHEAIVGEALRFIPYFQGESRIEPEAIVTSYLMPSLHCRRCATSRTLPLPCELSRDAGHFLSGEGTE